MRRTPRLGAGPARMVVGAATAGILLAVSAALPSGHGSAGRWVLAAPSPSPRPVLIKAREFAFDPKEVTARAGEVTFEVKNEGSIEHNFVIEDTNRRTLAQIPIIEPGKTEDVKATVRPGTYPIVCSLPGHKEAGMTGTLRVQP
ncbi:MAG: cupredoxin domain-containing protein [Armatimonadota bacterium]|nr:cupredoxin domain-containing protein [Armatimonadota bacterium]